MNEYVIINRDPTDEDESSSKLWWNMRNNKFFMCKYIGNGKTTWNQVKEKKENVVDE